jgi:hypothetical protein
VIEEMLSKRRRRRRWAEKERERERKKDGKKNRKSGEEARGNWLDKRKWNHLCEVQRKAAKVNPKSIASM